MYDYTPEDINYSERVAAGIALFDEQWAEWWTEDNGLDLSRLDIASGYNCATAQAAQHLVGDGSDWAHGAEHFGLTTDDKGTYILHGFNVESGESWDEYAYDSMEALEFLTALWINAALDRRKAHAAQAD